MSKPKYYRDGIEIGAVRALDRNGVLRDGFTMRVPMRARDSQDAKPAFTDGHSTDPLALQRPGFRIPVVNDRRAVHDAYEAYETALTNAYRIGGDGTHPDPASDAQTIGAQTIDDQAIVDHRATMDRLYAERDAELADAWRTK